MNTRFLNTLSLRAALLVATFGAITMTGNAQTPIARATVPFEFAAGAVMMPAGEYTVEVPGFSGVLVLRGSNGNAVALFSTFSGTLSNHSDAKLVFDRRDGMAHLSSIEWPSETAHVMSAYTRITKGTVATALR